MNQKKKRGKLFAKMMKLKDRLEAEQACIDLAVKNDDMRELLSEYLSLGEDKK